jgi:hypothetical protein
MSRIDKLKEQHPELNVSVIDLLSKVDPTDSHKYTEFLVKRIKEWYGGGTIEKTHIALGIELIGTENVEILNEFEIHSKAGRIKKNDIGQHKDFVSLSKSVNEAKEILKQKEAEKQTIKLMDTDEYCIIIPLSYEASKIYGSGTKWCTTQERHWNDYKDKYKLIYIIQKTTNKKFAISRRKGDDTQIQAWLDNDNEVSPFLLPLPPEVMTIITDEVRKNECVKDLIKFDKSIDIKPMGHDLSSFISKYLNNSVYGSQPNSYSSIYASMYDADVLKELIKFSYYSYRDNLYSSVDTGIYNEDEDEEDDSYIDTQDIF